MCQNVSLRSNKHHTIKILDLAIKKPCPHMRCGFLFHTANLSKKSCQNTMWGSLLTNMCWHTWQPVKCSGQLAIIMLHAESTKYCHGAATMCTFKQQAAEMLLSEKWTTGWLGGKQPNWWVGSLLFGATEIFCTQIMKGGYAFNNCGMPDMSSSRNP